MYFIDKIDPAVKDDADNADSNNEYEAYDDDDDDADEDEDGENGNYEDHIFDNEVQMFSSSSSDSDNNSSLTSDNDDDRGDDDDNNNEKKIIGSAKEGNLVSSSINNKSFEQPNPTRSVRITGFDFEGKDDNEISGGFDSIEYISEDAIARAILKPCCKEECLRKKLNSSPRSSCLNFESVYNKVLEARKQLVGNTIKDKTLILKTIIQGNTIKIYNISFRCLFIKQHASIKTSFAVFRRSFFVEF